MTPKKCPKAEHRFAVVERVRGNRYGYCSRCLSDMQQFADDRVPRVYNSHRYARVAR